ncbi:MAG TPA: NUDIX hydrolase, partial [Aequorivita sp.]|nr:NUDIX hydrolase [Aequorivita sp.]
MYKVFVKDIPIILSTEKNIGEHYTTIPLKQA